MALKDKLMTLEDFKAVRDVDVASNSAQFTEIKADLDAARIDLTQVAESAIVSKDVVSNWALGNLSTSTGKPVNTQTTIYTPDYYLVNANTKITFNGVAENHIHYAYFYDKNKTFISPRTTAKPYTVPNDAVYVRFSYGFTSDSGITVASYGGVDAVANDWNVICVSALRSDVDNKINDALASTKKPAWKVGGYSTNGTTPVFDESYTTLNCMCLNVAAGEQYIVSTVASLNYLPWVFTDDNLSITRGANTSSVDTTLTVADGETKLFINNVATNTSAKVYHLHSDSALSELRGDVDDLQKLSGNIATLETVGNVCPFRDSGGSSNGVELAVLNNNAYRIVGTATAYTTFSVFNGVTSFPDGMSAGKTYRMLFNTPNLGVTILLNYYDQEGNSQTIGTFTKDSDFSIPVGALGFRMRITVSNNTVCNYIIRPQIYAYTTLSGARTIKNKNAQPMLSIIYDDGKSMFKEYILPIIESKNVPIATAIMPESIGSISYLMSWEDVQDCYSRGAEILEHVITHSEEEWNAMGTQAISKLYLSSRNAIFAHGLHTPNVFVFAGASANHAVCRNAAMRIFNGAFNAGGGAINQYGNIDPYSINRYATDPMTLAQLKSLIDDLVTSGTGWMVWTRHNDSSTVAQNTQDLADAIDYALSKGVPIVTVERGLAEYLDMY